MNHLHRFFAAALLFAAASPSQQSSQDACANFGGHPTPSRCTVSPFEQDCGGSPTPLWRLFAPAHRAPGPRTGHEPGDARPLPCLLVTYRCTGLWWLPSVPDRVRTMGYVVDQPDRACLPVTP